MFHIFKESGINLTSHATNLPKMNLFLLVVAEIWVEMNTWADIRIETQDQLLDSPLVIGPVVNNCYWGGVYSYMAYLPNIFGRRINVAL